MNQSKKPSNYVTETRLVSKGDAPAQPRNPAKYHLLPDVLEREAIGIAFAPGDEEFARGVRDAVVGMMESGKLE